MDASTNLAEAVDTTPTPSGNDYVAVVKKAVKEEVLKEPEVDIAPKPPVWQKSFGDLRVLNTQAGALVQYNNGLVFIPGHHVTDTNIFELDQPKAPVRRLGRPKGVKNKPKTKAKAKVVKAKKSKGGRPKGSKNKVKRGPGRPKGSKNKK